MVIIIACFSSQFAPTDPLKINARNILKSPSKEHLLGTDQLGRDILSRLIYGSRISLSISAAAVLLAAALGVTLGLIAGYIEGWVDNAIMRVVDILVCVPAIFVAIVVVAFLGSSVVTLIFAIGLLYFPQFAKVVHGVTSSLKRKDFVAASVSLGASGPRIVFHELLPNLSSIIIVQISFTISTAMLLEAGLSFLGLGIMPPQPSWGQMVGELKDFININPLLVVFPSMMLFFAIFSINMIGDWLQDWLNPEITR
jgi:peptide/nickel transport system permease protein